MLDNDRSDRRVGEQPCKRGALAVQPGADLGDHLVYRHAVLARPEAKPARLSLEVGSPVVRTHPAVGDGAPAGVLGGGLLYHDRARRKTLAGTGIDPSRNQR